jgi:hypothetical protein
MKILTTLIKFILICSCLFPFISIAGDRAGNGTEDGENISWFLGQAPVKYCIELNPDPAGPGYFSYSFGKSGIEIAVKEAIKEWADYIEKKKVYSDQILDKQINLNYVLSDKCDSSSDLIFYFGHDPESFPKIKLATSKLNKPYAVAYIETYSVLKNRGKGFVWINENNYYTPYSSSSLKSLLMHELGHILGNDHTPNTIMDSKIINTGYAQETSIDQKAEFYFCPDCTLNIDSKIIRSPESFKFVKDLTNREASCQATIIITH